MKKDVFENSGSITLTTDKVNGTVDLHVLVVEDDFGDFDDISRTIRKMSNFTAQVTCARTLEEARQAIREKQFDIALVDYCLGSESGARFLRDMGGRCGTTPAILLTGLLTKEPQEIAIEAGAIGCLNKDDLSPRLLESTIRCALYTHQLEKKIRNVIDQFAVGTPIVANA